MSFSKPFEVWKWREIRMTRKPTEFRYIKQSTANLWRRGRFLCDGQTPRKDADTHRLDDSSISCFNLEHTWKRRKYENEISNETNDYMLTVTVWPARPWASSFQRSRNLENFKINKLKTLRFKLNNQRICRILTILRPISSFAVKRFKMRRTTSSGRASSEHRARGGIRVRSLIFRMYSENLLCQTKLNNINDARKNKKGP